MAELCEKIGKKDHQVCSSNTVPLGRVYAPDIVLGTSLSLHSPAKHSDYAFTNEHTGTQRASSTCSRSHS